MLFGSKTGPGMISIPIGIQIYLYLQLSLDHSRMAVVLWGSKTPGAAQIERDKTVNNNKKKVVAKILL